MSGKSYFKRRAMPEVKVSVIIPTSGRIPLLLKAVKSVLNQTFQDFEIIVVDDSSDGNNLPDSLRELQDERIKYFRNDRTKGSNGSRNTGIMIADGRYIAILDDDDLFNETKLEKQYDILENNPDIGVVTTQAYIVDENGEIEGRKDETFNPEEIFYHLIFNNFLTHSSIMFRKGIIPDSDYYNESLDYAQDYDLWGRLIGSVKFFQINEKLVSWRKHERSKTGEGNYFQRLSAIYTAKENIERFSNMRVSVTAIARLQDRYYKNVFELNESIRIFNAVYAYLLDNYFSGRKSGIYKKRFFKIAMIKKVETALYYFFKEQKKGSSILYFMQLPFIAKRIILKKIVKKAIGK